MITGSNVANVARIDPVVAHRLFDNGRTYALGNRAARQNQAPPGYASRATLVYRSYADFVDDLEAATIDPAISVVLYDPERWSDTPQDEQLEPLAYMRRFALLAHVRGYRVILAPARDLMDVHGAACASRPGEPIDHSYLRCNLPSAASFADVFEIQAQTDEFETSRYAAFVRAAATQARLANPNIEVLAGLSTGPASGTANVSQLSEAAHAVERLVSGYWLNIRASEPGQLETAFGFLEQVAAA